MSFAAAAAQPPEAPGLEPCARWRSRAWRFGADKYLLRQVRKKLEFTDTVQAVLDLTEWVESTYPARKTHVKLVEDKANGPAVISQLRRRVPGLIAVDPQGDKVARARAVAPDVEAANVYLPGAPNAAGTDYDPFRPIGGRYERKFCPWFRATWSRGWRRGGPCPESEPSRQALSM